MRSTRMNPLMMCVEARATPAVARMRSVWSVVSLITISAAIIETEEMALVSAISGVCSSLVTCRISSMPRKVAITNTRRLVTRSSEVYVIAAGAVAVALTASSSSMLCLRPRRRQRRSLDGLLRGPVDHLPRVDHHRALDHVVLGVDGQLSLL